MVADLQELRSLAAVEDPTREVAARQAELRQRIRDEIGAIATPKDVRIVPRLPKTRSGKILRAPMRSIVDGVDFEPPATIEDPAALDEMRDALGGVGAADAAEKSEETISARL